MELIDLRQLRAFHSLAETRSFTGAAQRLYLTQSAVSHSIKALENSLECKLFDRAGKLATLTAQGRILLKRSERIFQEMQSAAEELSDMNSWGHGKLRIAATMTMCQYLLPSVLHEFGDCFPDCDIRIEAGDTEEILELLQEGEIDIALGLRLPRQTRYEYRNLFEDELSLIISPTHPWASKKRLTREDMEKERFIVYSRNSYTFRLVENYFDKQGISLNSPLELGSMEAIKEMAKIGLGIAVVAPWIASEEISQGILSQRIISKPRLTREWGLFFNKGKTLSLAEETFSGICESVAQTFILNKQMEMGGQDSGG